MTLKQMIGLTICLISLPVLAKGEKANRHPNNVPPNCAEAAKRGAERKASEHFQNCRGLRVEPRPSVNMPANMNRYVVDVGCPAFAGDTSFYQFVVTTKIAFGMGNGAPVCFASKVDPMSAPDEALE